MVIVYADDESRVELNQPFNAPWDRRLHVELLEKLATNGARMVFFDFAFLDRELGTDPRFAQAIGKHGKTFLAAAVKERSDGNGHDLLMPREELGQAAAGWGLLTFNREDTMNAVRRMPMGYTNWPSVAWVMATNQVEMEPSLIQKAKAQSSRMWLNYYGRAESLTNSSFFSNVPFHRALSGEGLPPAFFTNKFVFVGGKSMLGFVGQRRDEFSNPWSRFHPDRYSDSPGVEVHATAFLNLIRGEWLVRLPEATEMIILILVGLGLGYGLSVLRPLPATGLSLLLICLVPYLDLLLVAKQYLWFPWAIVACAQIPFSLGWSVVFHSLRSFREKALLKQTLGRHLSPRRVEEILKRPELLKPYVERKEVSILFTDIENYSRVADLQGPNDLSTLLNEYYAIALQCVHETDGMVMDLIGDAIFAIWNAPDPQSDHWKRAIQTAISLQTKLRAFEQKQYDMMMLSPDKQAFPLKTRIGLHSGQVSVGNIGSSTRFDYTAIGSHVNLAHRLESLNKQLGTRILSTRYEFENTDRQREFDDGIVHYLVGYFRLKGIDKAQGVYEIIGWKKDGAVLPDWCGAFANARLQFTKGRDTEYAESEASFKKLREIRGAGLLATFYLKEIERLRSHPPPEGWMGEIDLEEK
jgi:adenylate cyclase